MCRMLQPLFVSCFLTATAPLCLWQKQQMRCLFKVWLHLPHVCIHTRVCIHVCAVTNICSCLWRPEDDLRDHASGSVYHFDFETRPLTDLTGEQALLFLLSLLPQCWGENALLCLEYLLGVELRSSCWSSKHWAIFTALKPIPIPRLPVLSL